MLKLEAEWLRGEDQPRWPRLLAGITKKNQARLFPDLLKRVQENLYCGEREEFIRLIYSQGGCDWVKWAGLEQVSWALEVMVKIDKEEFEAMKKEVENILQEEPEDLRHKIVSLAECLDLSSRDDKFNQEIKDWRRREVKKLLTAAQIDLPGKEFLFNKFSEVLTLADLGEVLSHQTERLAPVERIFCQRAVDQDKPGLILEGMDEDSLRGLAGKSLGLSYLLDLSTAKTKEMAGAIEEQLKLYLSHLRWFNKKPGQLTREAVSGVLGEGWEAVIRPLKESTYWHGKVLGSLEVRGGAYKKVLQAVLAIV
jgi:hypothetical protein